MKLTSFPDIHESQISLTHLRTTTSKEYRQYEIGKCCNIKLKDDFIVSFTTTQIRIRLVLISEDDAPPEEARRGFHKPQARDLVIDFYIMGTRGVRKPLIEGMKRIYVTEQQIPERIFYMQTVRGVVYGPNSIGRSIGIVIPISPLVRGLSVFVCPDWICVSVLRGQKRCGEGKKEEQEKVR